MSQRQVLMFFAALGTLTPVVAFALVLLGKADPHLAADVSGTCILVSLLGAIAAPFLPIAGRGATPRDRIVDLLVVWTWTSAVAQLGWEMPFVLLSPWLKGATASDHWAFLFWAYGVADSRYLIADPFTVCMEAVTSMIGGPLELYALYLFKRGERRRPLYIALVVSATQLYGTILFFAIEALEGFRHVGSGLVNVWVKFVGLNAVWLLMPTVCLGVFYVVLKNGLQEESPAAAAVPQPVRGIG